MDDSDEPTAEIEWKDPPSGRRRYDWESIADQLREHPMDWALIFERDRVSVVNAIRQGQVAPVHPDLGIELKTRNNTREPIRTCSLYLRFNPDKVDSTRQAIEDARRGSA